MQHKLNSVVLSFISTMTNPFTPNVIEVSIGKSLSSDDFFSAFGLEAKNDSYNVFEIGIETNRIQFFIAPKTVGMTAEDTTRLIEVPMQRAISLQFNRVNF